MNVRALFLTATLTGVGLWAAPALAQTSPSRCADCHVSRPDAPGERHVADWDTSPHGRNAIGCETCHGGNASTFEPVPAHQGILHFSNSASPVARVNLPGTCGKCHTGAFAAFQKSRHYELVRAGNRDAPTCATCHGEVGAQLLSPRQLEGRCAGCHGDAKQWGALRLDSRQGILDGGDSGPAVVPGNAAVGELAARLASHDDAVRMPPPEEGPPVSPDVLLDFSSPPSM
jgi:hypothetical protein